MMNEEIHVRIKSAYCAFGRLRKRMFDCRELTVKTKVKVKDQCIIPLLLNGSVTSGQLSVLNGTICLK